MCGALLPETSSRRTEERRQRPVAQARQPEQESRERFKYDEPVAKHERQAPLGVSGPSFLGLSDAGEEWNDRDLRSYNEDLYRTNWGGRAAFALLILAAVAGLMYVQWRSGHRLTASPNTPGVTQPQSAPNGNPEAQKENQIQGAEQNAANPQASADQQKINGADNSKPESGSSAKAAGSDAAGKSAAVSPDKQEDSGAEKQSEESADSGTDDSSEAASSKSARASSSTARAAPASDNAEQQVRQAEIYLEGKGVPQNCDEGVGILRTASQQGNLRAVVKLGALYATGTCLPQDRVMAYRYFTQAYHAEPRNQALDHNRVMLWANMTDEERRRALEPENP